MYSFIQSILHILTSKWTQLLVFLIIYEVKHIIATYE